MKSKNGFWYFAHPYTCRNPVTGAFIFEGEEANFNICNYRAGELLKRGYNIYSPISHTHPIHRATPEFLARQEHDVWYTLDLEFMDRCNFDGIILAPGWENSTGCIGEVNFARAKGWRILLYDDIVAGKTVEGETLAEFEREKNGKDANGTKTVQDGGSKGQ